MVSPFASLVRLSSRHPRFVLAGWAALVAVAAVFALQLDGALTAGGFEDPRSTSAAAQKVLAKRFDVEPNDDIAVLTRHGGVTSEQVSAAVSILRSKGATDIVTPAEEPALKSSDGSTVAVIGGFPGSNSAVQDLTPALQHELGLIDDVTSYLTGQPALDYQLNVHSKEDAVRAELIAFPALILVLLIIFRSVVATIVPLVLAGGSLAISMALGFLATHITDISILYSNIVSMVGLAVSVDYSLFIIKRFREELSSGADVGAAVVTTFATAGRSVVLSGVAVAVALGGLFIPGLMAFTSIGLGGIIVTLVALTLTLTALPAALTLLGPRIDAVRIPLPSLQRTGRNRSTGRNAGALAGFAAATALIVVALPMTALSLQSPVASATILPAGDTARAGLELAKHELGASTLFPTQVIITAPADSTTTDTIAAVSKASSEIRKLDTVTEVTSVASLDLSETTLGAAIMANPKSFASLWSPGAQAVARLVVSSNADPDSVAAHKLVTSIRAVHVPSGYELKSTGASARGLDFDTTLEHSIPLVIGFVFLTTFLMLLIAFRNALLPVIALVLNSLVVGASLGILTLATQFATHAPVNSVTPILLFAVMFGLSMDYMVIIVSRIIEAHGSGLDYDAAIRIGTRRTRAMVNSAAVIMVAVFAAFMSAQISVVREIGIGLGVAVIIDALVIRMLVLPALLRAIGSRAIPRTDRFHAAKPATTLEPATTN